jgi:hypothetical protein
MIVEAAVTEHGQGGSGDGFGEEVWTGSTRFLARRSECRTPRSAQSVANETQVADLQKDKIFGRKTGRSRQGSVFKREKPW